MEHGPADPASIIAAFRSRLSLERNRDRVGPVPSEQTNAARTVRQRGEHRYLAVAIDHGIAEVRECCASRCDLIGDEQRGEIPAIAAENAEVGLSPLGHFGKERHLAAIVHNGVGKEREAAARRRTVVITRDADGLFPIGAKDSLSGRRAAHARKISDGAVVVYCERALRRYRAAAGRQIAIANEGNDRASAIHKDVAAVDIEHDVAIGRDERVGDEPEARASRIDSEGNRGRRSRRLPRTRR